MPVIKIPAPLRSYVEGHRSVVVSGRSVKEALGALVKRFPAIQSNLYDPEGRMRSFINLFLQGVNVKDLPDGLLTGVEQESEIFILATIAGG